MNEELPRQTEIRLPDDPGQMDLLDISQYEKPKTEQEKELNPYGISPWKAVKIHFASREDRQEFSELIEQPITDDTQAILYPKPDFAGQVVIPEGVQGEPEPEQPTESMDDGEQMDLLDVRPDWHELWRGMPDFVQENLMPWKTIEVHFHNRENRKAFGDLIGQEVSDNERYMRCFWFPEAEIGHFSGKLWVTDQPVNPRYPVYIISKGRWETRLTAKAMEKIGIPYRIVVEPQEVERYAAVIAREKILSTPFSNLGLGSIPVRNFVWEHAIAAAAVRHWVIDDNIDGFYRLHRNLKVPVGTGAIFRAVEDFCDRYENVGIAGLNYFMFAPRKAPVLPFTLNTRIYSCILIKNDIPYRWRGRYNEDTDLSIRALKDGWCTVLFNAFLALKQTTMSMKGGNTDELYKGDGRKKMAESLLEQHPDVVTIVEKWGRWQHQVNYKPFRRNKLIQKAGVYIPEGPNHYGMTMEGL